MHFKALAPMLAKLMLIQAALMAVPLLISLAYQDGCVGAFALTACILTVPSVLMMLTMQSEKSLTTRESLLLVTLAWIFVSFFGALPFYFSGSIPSLTDAIFESVSGFTTTGATILTNIEALPPSMLFWRSFTHWIGGLGVLLFLFFLGPMIGGSAFRLFKAESPSTVKTRSRTGSTAKTLFVSYFFLTFSLVVLLLLGGMDLLDAFIHTFSTVATAGYSSHSASIGYFQSDYINIVLTVYMILSGVNFFLIFAALHGQLRQVWKDEEVRLYLGITLVSSLLIAGNLYFEGFFSNIFKSFEHAIFQVSSILTTTGFATVDFNLWPSFSKFILFMLTFVGACSSSTTCAIKVVRILILFKCIHRTLYLTVHPNGVRSITLNGKAQPERSVQTVQTFFFVYMMLFVGGTLLTLAFEPGGLDLVTAMTATATTLSNVGPGLELVGPMANFGFLTTPTKWLEVFLMIVGRLELFTMLPLLLPGFWSR